MHPEVLSKGRSRLAEKLAGSNMTESFYLAGGTALALRLGHRMSEDLDFFSNASFSIDELVRDLASLGKMVVDRREPGTLVGSLSGVRISFLSYGYPLVNKVWSWSGLQIADPVDIACMKLIAVGDRGLKRDFIDMYFLLREVLDLDALFDAMETKYAGIDYNRVHLLKGLTFFDDAEADPMPKMLVPVDWEEAKAAITQEVEGWLRHATG